MRATMLSLALIGLTTSCAGASSARGEEAEMARTRPCGQIGYRGEAMAWRSRTHYGQGGRLERLERDSDADGRVDSRTYYHYNADGQLVIQERDLDGDGHIDARRRLEYDARGRVRARLDDPDADGRREQRTTFERDARGRVIAERDAGGVLQRTTYDASGCAIARQWLQRERVTRRHERRCDARGHIVRERIDGDGDGVFEQERRHRYTARGQLTETLVSVNGRLRERREMRYDAFGYWRETRVDGDGDGRIDRRTVADYSCWATP